jgi:hypothetical protein
MTRYNNNRFTPGNKGNLRIILNKVLLNQNYNSTKDILCGCIQQRVNNIKQGWNDPSQPENIRIAQTITSSLGGRIVFGNFNNPVALNHLGDWEGQPGGTRRPLRNKF